MAASIKVAFVGDQGVGEHAVSVLSLVANEGTDLLLIQGDLGYRDNSASTWEANLNNSLGSDFPVLTVVGNHENFEWPTYQRLIEQRISRADGLSCSGNTGVKAKCSYGNIDVVQVAPGMNEVAGVSPSDGYADFIRSSLSGSDNRWRICSWHKPHYMMHTGSKTGPSVWDVYDACLDTGAMIALAHEHSYSRTYLLSDFSSQKIVHRSDNMSLQPGQSFAFVSGLGGREVRGQTKGGDYFASIYTADQGASAGALFCTFGDTTADCYFKAIDGAVPDQFSLTLGAGSSQLPSPPPPVSSTESSTASASSESLGVDAGYVFSRSDKTEYRWIDQTADGQSGSIWINEACAASLGGAAVTGTWKELMRRAPKFDKVANPCSGNSVPAKSAAVATVETATDTGGFAFSRTDKTEYRWIEKNASGSLGSVWIDKACVDRVGGVKQTGDWKVLMAVAPGFDTIASPCY